MIDSSGRTVQLFEKKEDIYILKKEKTERDLNREEKRELLVDMLDDFGRKNREERDRIDSELGHRGENRQLSEREKRLITGSRDKDVKQILNCGHRFAQYECKDCKQKIVYPLGCKHRLCPVCGSKRAMSYRCKLIELVSDPKRDFLFVTLTVKNVNTLTVEYLKWLRGCLIKLRHRQIFKSVTGGVYAFDFTFNKIEGTWHAHIHILMTSGYIDQGELSKVWCAITQGSYVVWIEKADDKALNELVKYSAKLADFIGFPERLDEFLVATRGLRALQTFGDLYNVKLSDKEVQWIPPCPVCGGPDWEFVCVKNDKFLWLPESFP